MLQSWHPLGKIKYETEIGKQIDLFCLVIATIFKDTAITKHNKESKPLQI